MTKDELIRALQEDATAGSEEVFCKTVDNDPYNIVGVSVHRGALVVEEGEEQEWPELDEDDLSDGSEYDED